MATTTPAPKYLQRLQSSCNQQQGFYLRSAGYLLQGGRSLCQLSSPTPVLLLEVSSWSVVVAWQTKTKEYQRTAYYINITCHPYQTVQLLFLYYWANYSVNVKYNSAETIREAQMRVPYYTMCVLEDEDNQQSESWWSFIYIDQVTINHWEIDKHMKWWM